MFMRKLEKYSAYQPTPLSIEHFINFAKNARPQTSFIFLKHELPVRLANIMKELQLLPYQIHETEACRIVVKDYAQSFKDVLVYEKSNPKDPNVLKDFTKTIDKIRDRHTNTVITMAEAVMAMKHSATSVQKSGKKRKRIQTATLHAKYSVFFGPLVHLKNFK